MAALSINHVLLVIKDSTDPQGVIQRRVRAFLEEAGVRVTCKEMDFYDHNPDLRPDDGLLPDAVIVIGGDGTFLRTARVFAEDGIPMVGINRGHLGFLTRIEVNELEASLSRLLEGDYSIEERAMLSVQMPNGGNSWALNDVVLKGESPSQLIRLDLWLANALVAELDADGLIISTATGSTAYNLAAGGPVLSPTLGAFCVTPICPHSFAAKPILVPVKTPIRVVSAKTNSQNVVCSADGQAVASLAPGEALLLSCSDKSLPWISFDANREASFYHLLSAKLGWADNPRTHKASLV